MSLNGNIKAILECVSVALCRPTSESPSGLSSQAVKLFVFELIWLMMLVLSATISLICFYEVSNSAADCHGTYHTVS